MRINTNLTALNTYTQYSKNNSKIGGAVAKLSSGYAINTAADNAAGLAISEKMRAQIRGLEKASANSQDAISLVQTAEGALSSSTTILQRMRELAVQSSSDTNEDTIDRAALQDEFSQLQSEIDDIAKSTSFNKRNLLDGSLASSIKSVTNATLQNSGMTVTLGNAADGIYNFSVTTKLEAAAVTGQAPDSFAINIDGASSYFNASASSIAPGGQIAASDLLNGNYKLSATYGEDKQVIVTATGDNGQTFSAVINNSALTGLASDATLDVTFNAEADDAFSLTLELFDTINSTDNNFSALASKISDLTVSVSGGVTAKAAEYGVYANLTGAESIKLETGMSSVSFDNGIKVNFDKLTAASVDTANNASLNAGVAVNAAGITAADPTDEASVAMSYSNFTVKDDSAIANGADFAISSTDAGVMTATITDSEGNVQTYTASATIGNLNFANTDLTGAQKSITNISFTDSKGNEAFSIDLTATLTQGTVTPAASTTTGASVSFSGEDIAGAGHNYELTFGSDTSDLSASTVSSFNVESRSNKGLTFQIGANEGDEMIINIGKMDAKTLGISSASVATQSSASSTITAVDKALNQVSVQRAYLGAIQNRLENKISDLDTSAENLTSAESQIRDVDMAREMTQFTSANILQQAATAMLAQANSLPQNVLSLLKG